MALTDTEVRRAKKKEKPYKLSDGGNLFLWVTPSGGKLWRWAYRYDGKEKLMTFGRYPEVSLALVRERHMGARSLLAVGVDPMAERKAVKSAAHVADESSFATLAGRWIEHWQQGKSPRHVDSVRRRMAADILPRLGARSVAEIDSAELVAMIKTIEQRGAGDIAKRALQVTGQVFRYAIAHGFATRNPAIEFRPSDILKATRKRNYARVDAKELPDLLRKIEVYQGTHVTRLAMKLLALTFVRTSELIKAKWSEFDLEGARWDIPPNE
jgi:Arm DNA-binding domain